MKTSAFATLVLAAVLLALAPGRAAAAPPAIFVSNFGGKNVPAYDATGAAATGYSAPSGFTNPEGVAYNPANNTLYVADASTNHIRTFDTTTNAETTSTSGFANAAGLSSPVGLAFNAGMLYTANSFNNTVTAYNAATGARVTTGFTSPTGLNGPIGLAVTATTLFVTNVNNNTLGAFNLATGAAVPGFAPVTGLNDPIGVALFGNDLFVADEGANTVREYDATTGAVINASFITGLNAPRGLAVLGSQLLVAIGGGTNGGTTVGAYGIPDVATLNNMPTSANASFLTGLNEPNFIAVVPEPSTWALLAIGTAGLGLAAMRQRARWA